MKFLKLLISFFYLMSCLVFGKGIDDGLELNLLKLDESVYVTVRNNGVDIKALDSNLCVNGIGDLSFSMRSDHGFLHALAVKLNERCELNRTIYIRAKEFIGKEFFLHDLKINYKLPNEKIHMKAMLCKKQSNCIESNEIILSNPKPKKYEQ